MAVYEHDVLVIGAGLAGHAGSDRWHRQMGADVAMISKVHPVRSHSNAAQGGINGPGVGEDGGPWEEHAFETTKASDYLGDQDAIEILAKEGGARSAPGRALGRRLQPQAETARMAVRRFGGMGKARTFFVGAITGQAILHVLYEQLMKPSVYQAMRMYEEWFVTSLIVDDGQCRGAVAMNIRTGELHAITAKATIICTGGLGRVYEPSTNALICTGDGIAQAYRAGAPIMDMEMVQIHPTTLKGIGRADHRGCARRGRLPAEQGRRALHGRSTRRTSWSSPLATSFPAPSRPKSTKGAASTAACYLDMRHLGEKLIKERLEEIYEIARDLVNIDIAQGTAADPPGRALHHGRRQDRRRWPDADAGAVLRRRGRLRQRARREPRRRELAARYAGLRPTRSGARGAVDQSQNFKPVPESVIETDRKMIREHRRPAAERRPRCEDPPRHGQSR